MLGSALSYKQIQRHTYKNIFCFTGLDSKPCCAAHFLTNTNQVTGIQHRHMPNTKLHIYAIYFPTFDKADCTIFAGVRLFARRTFTTPKIQTFTTPKFRHFPPPKKNICQEDNCHPQFFSLFLAHFSWLFRLTAHGGQQGWEGGGA